MSSVTLFVSYNSSNDALNVEPLIQRLRASGNVVHDSSDVANSLDNAQTSDVFIVCLSPNYAASDDCHSEFLLVHWQEKPVLPLLLGDVTWPPGAKLSIHHDYFLKLSALRLSYRSGDIDADVVMRSVRSLMCFNDHDNRSDGDVHQGVFSVETMATLYKTQPENSLSDSDGDEQSKTLQRLRKQSNAYLSHGLTISDDEVMENTELETEENSQLKIDENAQTKRISKSPTKPNSPTKSEKQNEKIKKSKPNSGKTDKNHNSQNHNSSNSQQNNESNQSNPQPRTKKSSACLIL